MANVKGANVLAAVKMLRAHRPRAIALLPAQFHRYLDERILPSSWYPEADLQALMRAVTFLLPGTPDPWVVLGRIAARGDLSSLYRHLLRPGQLDDTLRAVTSLWRTFHDTGELTVVVEAPGRALSRLRGYGATTREMCRVTGGYVAEMATLAGAREVKMVKLGCTLDGAPDCTWRMTWS